MTPTLCPACHLPKPCRSSVCEHPDLRQPAAQGSAWKPKCYIRSTRGWNGANFGQECALHGPFNSMRQRHGEYDIPCPLAPEDDNHEG